MQSKNYILFAGIIALILLSGCADKVTFQEAIIRAPVGFWYGLWHGICAPFSFIGHFFDSSISIYAIYNNGGWYDFGYLWGTGSISGIGIKITRRN